MKKYSSSCLLVVVFMLFLTSTFVVAQESKSNLKVMTYNIWNGFDWGKDTSRKENWIEWIRDKNPDVLALQELCGYTEERLKEDASKWGHGYVQLLKTEGYPVGLTSRRPITLKERVTNELWHGLLHCKTYGIDFFVVHLSPADCDYRLKEANIIAQKVKDCGSDAYIILGDFNAHSPFDEALLKRNESLHRKYLSGKSKNGYSNLRLGEFDYSVVSTFISIPSIDVSKGFIDINTRYTFPTPALIGIHQTADEVVQNKERIDYILTSSIIAKRCEHVTIYNVGKTESLSDHFPIMAEFNLN